MNSYADSNNKIQKPTEDLSSNLNLFSIMTQKGLFVTMTDVESIKDALKSGVYGQLIEQSDDFKQNYCQILADYLGADEGDHIFFFTDRTIYYGGQLLASTETDVVFCNSSQTPFSNNASIQHIPAHLNSKMNESGMFIQKTKYGEREVHQPFLLNFKDRLGYKGLQISSDLLYNRLDQKYRFPLPSAQLSGQGFGLITPAETEILIKLFTKQPKQKSISETTDTISLSQPLNKDSLPKIHNCKYESQLEAVLMANKDQLPVEITNSDTVLRQIPASSTRPTVDAVDIAIYGKDNGAFPKTLIELKNKKAGKSEAKQVERYVNWAKTVTTETTPTVWMYAPEFTGTFNQYISTKNKKYIQTKPFLKRSKNHRLKNTAD